MIWPIVSAIGRTLWLPDADGSYGFSLRTYEYFFSDDYSLANLRVTLWTTVVTMALLLVVCLPLALYLRFATGRLPAYVQGLAIFPLFVPSVILAYAFIRVLGPNGTVDLLLNAVGLPKIAQPLSDALGTGDRTPLGQHPADRPDPPLRARRHHQRGGRSRPRRRRAVRSASSGTSSCRVSAIRSWSPCPSRCSACFRPSPSPTCSARRRPR